MIRQRSCLSYMSDAIVYLLQNNLLMLKNVVKNSIIYIFALASAGIGKRCLQ